MADKDINILRSLKSCHISPPKNLFKKIWRAVTMHKEHSADSTSNLADSKQQVMNNDGEYPDAEIVFFRSLQDYVITPPAFSALKIDDSIIKKTAVPVKITKTVGFKYFTRVAAAVLIISFGLIIFHKTYKKNEDAAITFNNVLKDTLSTIKNDNQANTNETKNDLAKKTGLIAHANNFNHISRVKTISRPKKISSSSLSNTDVRLIDNDILLTLVSYKYNDYLPLLSEIKKNNKISLDQFSYVTISDKMNNILKKMYATRRNNKPTRKARRLKVKLEKWKKKDEKHFDSNTNNNPVDIIDLSEFILK